VHKIKMKRRK